MKSAFGYKFLEYCIPDHMAEALQCWIDAGIYPGSFLQAVLENNLREVYRHADAENFRNLPAYVDYLYNEAPTGCWGSVEKVKLWKGLSRRIVV